MAVAEFAVAQATARTDTGTRDFAVTGFTTPNAVMYFCGTGITNGTAAVDSDVCIGAADGTSERADFVTNEDGQGTIDNERGAVTDKVIEMLRDGSNTTDGHCDHSSFAATKAVVNWDNGLRQLSRVNALLIKATNVVLGTIVSNATENSTTESGSLGFAPNVIFIFSVGVNDDATLTDKMVSFGFAVNNDSTIEQACHVVSDDDGGAAALCAGQIRDNRCGANQDRGATTGGTIELTTFGADTFTITTRDDTGGDSFRFLALNVGDSLRSVVSWDAPSATGDKAVTGVGFQPDLVVTLCANHTAYNSATIDANAGGQTISLVTAGEEYSFSHAEEDAATTSNTQSLVDNKAINHTLDDGTSEHVATGPGGSGSLDSDGFTFNFSVAGSARKWRSLCIGQAAAGVTVPDQTLAPTSQMTNSGGMVGNMNMKRRDRIYVPEELRG